MTDRSVVVVADSACDIPEQLATSLSIRIVPLNIHFGAESFKDHTELRPDEFITRLQSSSTMPTTSQPAPSAFEDTFREVLDSDRDVVCVTIASKLSGTFNSANLASQNLEQDRVRVIDSASASIGSGMVALAAARAAQGGASLADVADEAEGTVNRISLFAALQTLEYLHKGGRIGRAGLLLGSVLNIKPILSIRDGAVEPIERVRTWRKAVDRLAAIAENVNDVQELAVMNIGNAEDASKVVARLQAVTPDRPVIEGNLGPVISTYAGPGCIGVVVVTKPT